MRTSTSTFIITVLSCSLLFTTFSISAAAHDGDDHGKKTEQIDETDGSLNATPLEENLATQQELEEKKAKKRKRDIIVYSCFGLSLFMLLWMRKKRREGSQES